MPIKIEWRGSCIYRHYSGDITAEEIIAADRQVINDSRFDQASLMITNALNVGQLQMSLEDATRISHFFHAAYKSNPRIKFCCLMVDETALGFASHIEFEFDQIGGTWDMSYFSTEEKMRAWLQAQPNFDAATIPAYFFE